MKHQYVLHVASVQGIHGATLQMDECHMKVDIGVLQVRLAWPGAVEANPKKPVWPAGEPGCLIQMHYNRLDFLCPVW